ncbi:MAG: hypothetical protein JWN08_2955 [Frankiales bacterium]|jgi:hypothetical protein|nr:hypothetical protein [Frankiales bacterium]
MTPPPLTQLGRFGGRAGLALAAVGLLAIALGINGAAGQLTVLAQVPYLISGGLLGLALVVLGAAMLVVQGAREDRALLESKLDLLAEAFLEGQGRRAEADAPRDLSGLVVAGTASYHVPGCRLVDGREATGYLTPAEAQARSLKACRVCQPDTAAVDVTVR